MVTDERSKAVKLVTSAGPEIRRLIDENGWMMKLSEVSTGFEFYTHLTASIQGHFASLTDRSMDVREFKNTKQAKDEPAQKYKSRLIQAARRADITNKDIIRDGFLSGLTDQSIVIRALEQKLSLDEIVGMAVVRESAFASALINAPGFTPFASSYTVAAVAATEDTKTSSERRRRQDEPSVTECPNCPGRHQVGACPAASMRCYHCGNNGHVARKCKKRMREETERNEDYRRKRYGESSSGGNRTQGRQNDRRRPNNFSVNEVFSSNNERSDEV